MSVRELAVEAERDPEEVLVTLWDEGLDYLDDLDNQLQKSDIAQARRALGVASPRERRKLSYWEDLLGISPKELREYMREQGVPVGDSAHQVPKGGLKRFERAIRNDPRWSTTVARAEGQRAAERAATPVQPATATPPLEWVSVGRERDISCLGVEEVEAIHDELARDFARTPDPIDPPGVRDPGLLESAVSRPLTSLGNDRKYPTVEMAAAALLHSIVHNHPFHNGNKRTALVAMLCFLDINNIVLTCSEGELFKFVLKVAQHRLVPTGLTEPADREVLEIAQWIRVHSRLIDRSERPIKWRELKAILRNYECSFDTPRTGNRLNIRRTVEVRRGLLRRPAVEELKHQTHYADDGREVSRSQLHELRKALRLDEEHGVDSERFYRDAAEIDDFIHQYRTVLRRLAKL